MSRARPKPLRLLALGLIAAVAPLAGCAAAPSRASRAPIAATPAPVPRVGRVRQDAGPSPGVVRTSLEPRKDAAPAPPADDDVPPRRGPGVRREAPAPADSDEVGEDLDLDRSRANRRGGGGGPTDDEEDDDPRETDEPFRPDLLNHALGLNDSDFGVFGWLQGGYTANPARPAGLNFGVNPNDHANRWMFQQIYFVAEKRLSPSRRGDYGWGFRADSLVGTDWDQFHMVGLFDGAFRSGQVGYDPVQFYGEVHLPWLTPGGVDVKGGRFYALAGYEDGRAPARPLDSAGYLFGYSHPFTQFGVMTTWRVTDRLNLYNGAVNGWDRWVDQNDRWGYAGGVSWDSADDRTNLTVTLNAGPNQFPSFFPAGYNLTPNGVTPPPFMAGRRNVLYGQNDAVLFTEVLVHEWTERLTVVGEADQGYEVNVPNLGPAGTPGNGGWYGVGGWVLYQLTDRLTGVVRGELFWDETGLRTGSPNRYSEATLGLIYKPRPWLWFRPEVRGDWASRTPVYDDATRRSQLTFGFDMILLY